MGKRGSEGRIVCWCPATQGNPEINKQRVCVAQKVHREAAEPREPHDAPDNGTGWYSRMGPKAPAQQKQPQM